VSNTANHFHVVAFANTDEPVAKGREPVATGSRQDANHRIANNLALIVALIRLQKGAIARQQRQYSAAEVGTMLAVAAGRIDAVGIMHRAMGEGTGCDEVELGPVVRAMCEPLVASLASPGRAALSFDLESSCQVKHDHAVPIALVIGEAVANVLKHAYPAGVAGPLRIACRQEAKQTLFIEIADAGIGLSDGFDVQTDGVGLKIVRALCKQIDAKFILEKASRGLRFRLQIPPG
jgi:two-component sensor histidine kinase